MNPIPDQMIDRWANRVDQKPGEGRIYWHILLGQYPEAVALAREAQRRLEPFRDGLHMTPLEWLHITIHIAGPADRISQEQIQQMTEIAERMLAGTPPITITLGRILYHREAIMLAADPAEALWPVVSAARNATQQIAGKTRYSGNNQSSVPHATVCYSTQPQPRGPITGTLGWYLPTSTCVIRSINLINQHGPERDWNWIPLTSMIWTNTGM